MNIRSQHISLCGSVRYRKEHFGGILFDTRTGAMIDVDREAYLLVSLLQTMGVVNLNDLSKIWAHAYDKLLKNRDLIRTLEELLAYGILAAMPDGILNKDYGKELENWESSKPDWPVTQVISAPETVHWAVTYKCDLDCPDCYIRRHRYDFRSELDTTQALAIVDKIADAGVFQLALGGGEPLLRNDIIRIVARAHERNLVVHVTTGRYRLEPEDLKEMARYIKSMQIGIKHEELIKHPKTELEKMLKLIDALNEQGLDAGANLILSRSTLGEFQRIIESLSSAGFRRITLLRYKPPKDRNRWIKEKPDEDALLEFEKKLSKTLDSYPHIQFRVDCGLTFLERKLPSQDALGHGIRGCSAAGRILSIAPDGSVFPCSQLVGEKFYAGSVMDDDFQSIWMNSKVLRRYRNFRTSKLFQNSHCGECAAKTHCGGCRVFAGEALGADPGCPEPVLPPARLEKYRQDDNYDTLIDIQESIGFTDGGFPYVTLEEIAGWLEEEKARDYPRWLMNNNEK